MSHSSGPSKILACEKTLPQFEFSHQEIVRAAEKLWFSQMPPREASLAKKVFEGAGIKRRFSEFPLELVFSKKSFQEKNDLYIQHCIQLGKKALQKAVSAANIQLKDIDILITTSCTGFMIPSLDAYLVENLNLRTNVVRLPITEMGCAGGTSALIYAHEFSKANPEARIAIVSVELPTITLQWEDYSPENLVSSAIFADGASGVIIGPSRLAGFSMVANEMFHFPQKTHLMGYALRDSGLKIILDRDIPDAIKLQMPEIILPFLKSQNLRPEEIRHFLIHPGGKKILSEAEKFLSQYDKNPSLSRYVLENYGNLSSSTILYILSELIRGQDILPNDLAYLLAFGPGFTAQSVLLRWIG